jgi:hypothetical protein
MTWKKHEDWMIQVAVRLPRELQERLKQAGGERGMGEEIRRRLEASFDAERAPGNPKTQELLDAISFAAEEEAAYYNGNWWEDPFAFDVFKEYVNLLLANCRPEGEVVPKPTELGGILFAPSHRIEVISRALVIGWERMGKRAGGWEKRR